MATSVNIPYSQYSVKKAARRHFQINYQPNTRKKIDPNLKRDLQPGWLLPYVAQVDRLLWGRWDYWAECQAMPEHAYNRLKMEPALALMEGRPINPLPSFVVEQTLPDEPIPPISWEFSESVIAMLERTLEAIPNSGSWRSWGSCWDYIRYFLAWTMYGFGHPKQPELPPEPRHCEGCSMRLYQLFDVGIMLLYPEDYWGRLIPEISSKSSQQAKGFYPTPLVISSLMADITAGTEDSRTKSFYESCVGTGSAMLAMSNHCLTGIGQDIDPLVVECALFQMFLYAPWLAVPIWWLGNTDLVVGNSLSTEAPVSVNSKYWYEAWGVDVNLVKPQPAPVRSKVSQQPTPVPIEELPPDPKVVELLNNATPPKPGKQLDLFDLSSFVNSSKKKQSSPR